MLSSSPLLHLRAKLPKLPHLTATTRNAWCVSAPVAQEYPGLLQAFQKLWGSLCCYNRVVEDLQVEDSGGGGMM